MTYREEFPDFDPATLPAIPATWKDTSWHNDSCPSFRTMAGHTVFIDFADKALRELAELKRFTIHTDPEFHDFNEVIGSTDIWDDVLKCVAEPMMKLPTVEELARAFADQLREDVSEADLKEVVARNHKHKAEGVIGVCASHDFCDANMTMLEAAGNVGIGSETFMFGIGDGSDSVIGRTVSDAWDMAKAADFWVTK